uniref:Uncharacterized protein n=1 Tax=Thermogemmatispora argillosa TaxID=2045280 RepID=A0A455T5U8_9CHLR|nr:hypothetical protein KTA_28500 [Thermogemmatispora argillosa]
MQTDPQQGQQSGPPPFPPSWPVPVPGSQPWPPAQPIVPPTWFPPPATPVSPPPPPGFLPPGSPQFPPYGYGGPGPVAPVAPAVPRASRRHTWLVALAISFFVVASLVSCGVLLFLSFQQARQYLSLSTSSGSLSITHHVLVEDYYTALQDQNYQLAYSLLASNATVKGQHLDLNGYVQLARAQDERFGKIGSFSIQEVDPNHFTVTVWRDQAIYDVHVTFAAESLSLFDGISSVDGI